jgi:cephalosporin hydroxylase
MKIDVQIISASRPECLELTLNSFKKFVNISTNRMMIHEDVVAPYYSKQVLDMVSDFDDIFIGDPPKGGQYVMDFMQSQWRTKYVLHLQDDWEFEQSVDVDRLVQLMEDFPHIDCIFFNKQINRAWHTKFKQRHVTYKDVDLVLTYYWPFLPGIWRVNSFRHFWEVDQHRHAEGFFNNQINKKLGGAEKQDKVRELAEKDQLGFYMLGELFDPRCVRHVGENIITLPWRKRQNIDYSGDDIDAIREFGRELKPQPRRENMGMMHQHKGKLKSGISLVHEPDAIPVIQEFLTSLNFELIVELGTSWGGFTVVMHEALPNAEIHTFDLFNKREPNFKWFETYTKNIRFYRDVDVLKEINKDVANLLKQRRVHKLLYCDNGDKPKEVDLYAKYLQPGDFIAVHDYNTEYHRDMVDKNSHIKNNFEPWNHEIFEKNGWTTRFWRRK